MSVYKVIQDIEAEDKLFGWMTLKQFIAFCIALFSGYLSVMVLLGKLPPLILPMTIPIALVAGLFAAPLSRVQPTEVWLAARLRFMFKPRRRIWDQSGVQNLVTITAPKLDAHVYQNNLSQTEVSSRLEALAHTLDSRGWAVKNVNVNLFSQPSYTDSTIVNDRLIDMSTLPRSVPETDIQASDDILDIVSNPIAQRFDAQVRATTQRVHDQAVAHMQATMQEPQSPGVVYSYTTPATPASGQSSVVAEDEEAFLKKRHSQQAQDAAANPVNHLRMIVPPDEKPIIALPPVFTQAQPPLVQQIPTPPAAPVQQPSQNDRVKTVTATPSPAILELAQNDDFSVATLAHQAKRKAEPTEVTIKLR